jgi:hypothetical protein
MRVRELIEKVIPKYFGLGSLGVTAEFLTEGKGILNRGTQAHRQEEQEALIDAGIATHTFRDAKQLAIDGEYPVEDFKIPYGNVKVFYWPNRELGKPYTLWLGGLPQDEDEYEV